MHVIRKLEDIEYERAVKASDVKVKNQIVQLQLKQETEYRVLSKKLNSKRVDQKRRWRTTLVYRTAQH